MLTNDDAKAVFAKLTEGANHQNESTQVLWALFRLHLELAGDDKAAEILGKPVPKPLPGAPK